MEEQTIRVVMLEDQPVFREAIKNIITKDHDIVWVGEADDGESGLSLVRRLKPHIVILDFHLKKLDGLALIASLKHLKKENLNMKILVLTQEDNPFLLLRMLEVGADSLLTKDKRHPIIQTLHKLNANEHILEETRGYYIVSAALKKQILFKLTEKERLCFEKIGFKDSNETIAKAFKMQPNSLTKLVAQMKKKLNIKTREEIIKLYNKFYPDLEQEKKLKTIENTLSNHPKH